jgi:hypothetical protein
MLKIFVDSAVMPITLDEGKKFEERMLAME